MNKYLSFLFILLLGMLLSCQTKETSPFCFKPTFFIWGFGIEGFPISEQALKQLEQETQISAQLIQFYLQWPTSFDHMESIRFSLDAIASRGAIPCITWEPMTIVNGVETAISYENILNGQWDDYIIQMANEIKAWNKPVIIRLAHEMNLERYHWGVAKENFNYESPDRYIKMFRYIVNLFRNQQVNQAFWAFCPNAESIPNQSWNTAKNYYPGDEYVDILGMDGYNWDITQEIAKEKKQSWVKPESSFTEIFLKIYQELKAIAPQKPILVFETSSVDRQGKGKSLWIKNAIETAKEWKIQGIVWFHAKKEEDWRIHQSDDAYVSIVRSAINPLQDWLVYCK